jgi:hypothetical protein
MGWKTNIVGWNRYTASPQAGFAADQNAQANVQPTQWRQTNPRFHSDFTTTVYCKATYKWPELALMKNPNTLLLAPAPGLQNSHDIAPIAEARSLGALLWAEPGEHKVEKPEPARARKAFHRTSILAAKKVEILSCKTHLLLAVWGKKAIPQSDFNCSFVPELLNRRSHSTTTLHTQLKKKGIEQISKHLNKITYPLASTNSHLQGHKSDKFMWIFTSYRQYLKTAIHSK